METEVRQPQLSEQEKPENGLKGLKHWREDLLAGLVVSLVSVPLSLGIALASGCPPICGLTSEIIAGLVIPFLGGAYVTISGPAAGLAPVIYLFLTQLGHGNLELGYHLITGVIFIVGLLQLLLTWLKWARFSYLLPSAAIQGMLASIGFMLMAKQLPNFIGHKYMAHEFFPIIAETPSEILHMNWSVFGLSMICLGLLFMLPKLKARFLKYLPPQLVVVIVGVVLGQMLHLDKKFLVSIPDNPLAHGIVPPDFKLLFADPSMWSVIASAVILLCFVDGTESLATIHAVDRLDPYRRRSSPDRTLGAMGISNICSSLIGGITIIPGIIKSTTCIMSGGRTAWVNFYNAVFLILFILIAKDQIKMIPIGALAAVLVHIGYKLAGVHKWVFIQSLGRAQLTVFVVTILVTLNSDLLVGIAAGMLVKLAILLHFNACGAARTANLFASIKQIFSTPVEKVEKIGTTMNVWLTGPVNCFNSLKLRAVLDNIPTDMKEINVHITDSVSLMDHSINTYFFTLEEDCRRAGQKLEVSGLDHLRSQSKHASSFRYKAKLAG